MKQVTDRLKSTYHIITEAGPNGADFETIKFKTNLNERQLKENLDFLIQMHAVILDLKTLKYRMHPTFLSQFLKKID